MQQSVADQQPLQVVGSLITIREHHATLAFILLHPVVDKQPWIKTIEPDVPMLLIGFVDRFKGWKLVVLHEQQLWHSSDIFDDETFHEMFRILSTGNI